MARLGAVRLPLDAPLDPSSDEARRWVQEELAKGTYHAQPSLLEQLDEWLGRLFSVQVTGGAPAVLVPVVIGLVLAVVALVLVRVLRREVGPTGPGARGVLDVPDVDAATLRRRTREAADRADWDAVVLDGLRTIARAAVERVVLDDAPGRTAHEVAQALGAAFPGEASALADAADAFDAVRYGHRAASEEQARAVVSLDGRMAAARPRRPQPAPVGG
jgi:hypothetical protein